MLQTIVIVQDFAHINGGNAKVALSEAIALREQDFRVIVFSAVAPIEKSLLESGVEVLCLNINDSLHEKNKVKAAFNGIWNRRAQREFSNLLFGLNPSTTIIHFHCWIKALSSSLFIVTARFNFKIVVTLHDFFSICPNGGLFNYPENDVCRKKPMSLACQCCNCDSRSRMQKYWRVIRQYFMNYALRKNKEISLISISALTTRLIVPELKPYIKKIYTVDNPVEQNQTGIVDIGSNEYYTLISRISEEKGIDMFCKAMRHLKLKGQVLGDGDLLGKYREKYPEVVFRGWCSGKDKELYVRQTKCLVLASRWYETFGLVVAEMKSYGIPSIVPDESAASEG